MQVSHSKVTKVLCDSTVLSNLGITGNWIKVTGLKHPGVEHKFSYTIDDGPPTIKTLMRGVDLLPKRQLFLENMTLALQKHTLTITNIGESLTLVEFVFGSDESDSKVPTPPHTTTKPVFTSVPSQSASSVVPSTVTVLTVSGATQATTVVKTIHGASLAGKPHRISLSRASNRSYLDYNPNI